MKKRLQYRLASLLALVTVCTIPLCLIECSRRQYLFEREVAAAFARHGGRAGMVWCGSDAWRRMFGETEWLRRIAFLHATGPSFRELPANCIGDLPELKSLSLTECDLRGVEFGSQVASLRKLASLSCDRCKFGAGDLCALSQSSSIVGLNLTNYSVIDGDLQEMSPMPALITLNLSDSNISSRGIASLAKHPLLERLRLDNVKADDGLSAALASIPKLRWVHVYDECITDDQLAAVRRECPWLVIGDQ